METSRELGDTGLRGDPAGLRSPPPNASACPLFYRPTVTFPAGAVPGPRAHDGRGPPVSASHQARDQQERGKTVGRGIVVQLQRPSP